MAPKFSSIIFYNFYLDQSNKNNGYHDNKTHHEASIKQSLTGKSTVKAALFSALLLQMQQYLKKNVQTFQPWKVHLPVLCYSTAAFCYIHGLI